jgi:integrase
MARVAFKLTPTAEGGFTTRKRIPNDVREEYARLYGKRSEDWFNTGPASAALATVKASEWHSEIAARIENIRAERRGGGRMLTPMQARALSGEWYHWFCARHLPNAKAWGADYWQHRAEELGDDVRDAMDTFWKASGEPWHPDVELMEIYEEDPAAKARGLAIVADHAESSQFLHAKGMVLEHASREMFLDCLLHDYFAATRLLIRRANDDYGTDQWPDRFPKFERTGDPGLTPKLLFERWVTGRKLALQTVDRWRGVFLQLRKDFPEHSAAAITPEGAQTWADGLINEERKAGTVRDVWIVACRTVFKWAVKKRLLSRNPFEAVHIDVPRKSRNRESKAFTADELKTILSAALAVGKPQTKTQAVRRWVPWILAYTGARAGEITQLRGADVIEQDGLAAIKITPEAGTVKTGQTRVVPLHQHLIEQGFPAWAHANGRGPLFYEMPAAVKKDDPTNPSRPRPVTARVHLAEWIRELGISDPELQPTHAFRHSFKQIARRPPHRIDTAMINWIVGHKQRSVADEYGEPTLKDRAEALKAFPRYEVTVQGRGDGILGAVLKSPRVEPGGNG